MEPGSPTLVSNPANPAAACRLSCLSHGVPTVAVEDVVEGQLGQGQSSGYVLGQLARTQSLLVPLKLPHYGPSDSLGMGWGVRLSLLLTVGQKRHQQALPHGDPFICSSQTILACF